MNDVSFKIDRTSGCWICTSHKAGTHGYPTTTAGGYCTTLHRKLYMQQTNKRLPRHIQVMHICDNPMCINPAHLKEGTAAMNMQDAANKNRIAYGARHHLAKLDDDKVRDIACSGSTNKELADKYNVTQATVWHIRKGKTWTRVTSEVNCHPLKTVDELRH